MQTHQEFDLFISHKSEDRELADRVHNIVKEIHPDWNIFLDSKGTLEQGSGDFSKEIIDAIFNSVYMIFVSSKTDYLLPGGWVYGEINLFFQAQNQKKDVGFNKDWFGIVVDGVLDNRLTNLVTMKEIITIESINDITKERIMYLLDHGYHNDSRYINDKRIVVNRNILMEKSINFAKKKKEDNSLFDENVIDDELLPKLTDKVGEKYDFQKLVQSISRKNLVIIGEEGGAGKTTLMTKVYFHFLKNKKFVPIYVDMRTLVGKDYLIERYVSMALFERTQAMSNEGTDVYTQILENEFACNNKYPTYLFILDGYNEIPIKNRKIFLRELEKWLRWKNVRIIISGRLFDEDYVNNNLFYLYLEKLSKQKIENYIENKGLDLNGISLNNTLIDIISIPMYLDMYVNTYDTTEINTKGDLLSQFIKRQNSIDASNSEEASRNNFCLTYILPAIAYIMTSHNEFEGGYLSNKELNNILDDVLSETGDSIYLGRNNSLLSQRYIDFFQENDYIDIAYQFVSENVITRRKRNNDILKYFELNCGLLRKTIQNKYEFVHQNYCDFLCASYIANEMCMSLDDGITDNSISKILFDNKVIEFISDILKEWKERPYLDLEQESWSYECNIHSISYRILDMIRNEKNNYDCVAPANIINILAYARKHDLSNCDFSNLNLTKTKLNKCIFYRNAKDKIYYSTFENSVINKQNLISYGNYNTLQASCFLNNELAVYDRAGMIKFWNIDSDLETPIRIISNIKYAIKKMLYSSDGNSIVGMTDNEIIKINILETNVEPEVLFISQDKLRNIFFTMEGDIEYVTILNPYNKKKICECDILDEYNFYGYTSASAIHSSGKELAFGHICGYLGLKIYFFDDDKGEWIDKNINVCTERINSIEYKGNEKCLLFTTNKNVYEYDTDKNKMINQCEISGKIKNAYYASDKIVVETNKKVIVFDTDFNQIYTIKIEEKDIKVLIKAFAPDNVYVGIKGYIYEFNTKLQCINSYKTNIGNNFAIGTSIDTGERYFVSSNEIYSISYGARVEKVPNIILTEFPKLRIDGKIGFKKNGNILISIDTVLNKMRCKTEVQSGLVINQCIFKNIKGTMSEEENIELLKQYGAIV
ncbi:MAG: hypothetical protein ACLRZ9_04625 [Eubacterium sp.]